MESMSLNPDPQVKLANFSRCFSCLILISVFIIDFVKIKNILVSLIPQGYLFFKIWENMSIEQYRL